MEGIEILNQYVHEGGIVFPWDIIGLTLCLVGLLLVLFSGLLAGNHKFWWNFLLSFGFTILLVGLSIGWFAPREEITRYQITIDDTVDFNEFNSKYKIIEQDGLIFTVEEREPG